MIWIKNTLKLDQFIASEALMDEISNKESLRVLEHLGELPFTKRGDLPDLIN
jgi:hypothetical protein